MTNDTKPSNPKDAFGSAKAPLGLIPDTGDIDVAMAFLEGALKYGRFNWRVAGVRASIYNDAIRRHLKKWWNGQNRDPATRVKHLGNLRACVDILLDAELCGMLDDDRPPALEPLAGYIDDQQALIAHLKEMFKDHAPPQYSQKSHPRMQTSIPPGMTYAEVFGVDEPVSVPPGTTLRDFAGAAFDAGRTVKVELVEPIGAFHDSLDDICKQATALGLDVNITVKKLPEKSKKRTAADRRKTTLRNLKAPRLGR